MSVYRVIDKLEALVDDGAWLPFGYRIVSYERLAELVEKLRSTLPEEVGRAKAISTNKDRVMREAQEKAEQIVSDATSAHAVLVDQNDVLRRARTMAEHVVRDAEERARQIRAGADAYAAGVLGELEGRLGSAIGSIRAGREALVQAAEAASGGSSAGSEDEERAEGRRRVAFDAENEAGEGREIAVGRLGKSRRESMRAR